MLARVLAPLVSWLDPRTRFHRIKDAESIFYLGSPHPVSRLYSNLYFSLAAGLWSKRSQDPSHLAVFSTGLDQVREPQRVLDVGTGGGGTAAIVAERWPDAQVTATDLSRRMLSAASQVHRQPNITWQRATSHLMPFANGEFDLVVFLNSVANPMEIARITSPGAQLLVGSLWPANADGGAWVGRWRDAGFDRVRYEDIPGGSWELYEKRAEVGS